MDLTYNQICELSYEEILVLMDNSSEIDDLSLCLEALTVKHYDSHPEDVWCRIEESLSDLSEEDNLRFTAISCLPLCKSHTDLAVVLTSDMMVHDKSENVRRTAKAFMESFIK